MRAFDFAGTNRQVVGDCVWVVELLCPLTQIAVTPPNRGLGVVNFDTFQMGIQGADYLISPPALQSFFLRIYPVRDGCVIPVDRLGRSIQVLADRQ